MATTAETWRGAVLLLAYKAMRAGKITTKGTEEHEG